jgi:hypothetical protein
MFVDRVVRSVIARALVSAILVAASALALPAAASAATITVTSNADSGSGTLRAALASAGSGDTIIVPAMTITVASTLVVSNGVTIQGAGAGATTLSGGNSNSLVFQVTAPGVTIDGMTISDGGGGIFSDYGLTLSHDAIVHNSGTGVYVGFSGGPLIIDHSLIAFNQHASGPGGGIWTGAGPGSLITDTTIAENTATNTGGGIVVANSGLTLKNDTIVSNGDTIPPSQGGNIAVYSGDTMQMGNTILAGGFASQGADCYVYPGASWTSLGHNAEDTDPNPDSGLGGCQSYFDPTKGDRTGLALQLGPLQNNGGQTDTVLPAATSPVIGQGDPATCLTDDQRDVARPQGSCDIGAVQRRAPASESGVASPITTGSAMLTDTLNTEGLAGSAQYVYGPTPGFGAQTPDTTLNATRNWQQAGATLTGLQPATTYYFALVVTTSDGTTTGPTAQFTTLALAPPVVCRVPRLLGDSLAKSTRALVQAHCALGRVSRARVTRHRRMVVLAQHPLAGTVEPSGFRVALTLGGQHAAARTR